MSAQTNESESAAQSGLLTHQGRASRILWLVFLGIIIGSFFHALLSDKTDNFEIAALILVWGMIAAVGYAMTAYFSPRLGLRQLLTVVLMSMNIYVGLNLLLLVLGVEIVEPILPLSDNTSMMLSLLGIQKERVFFPLSTGINSFGLIAGASFVVGYMNMLDQTYSRWIRIVAGLFCGASLAALFLADSRMAFGGALLVSALLSVFPDRKLRYLRFLPLASPVFPLLLVAAIQFVAARIPMDEFARSSSDMVTLNSRTIYWQVTMEHLVHFSPRHLIGYGLYGHRTSGVIADLLAVLPPDADPLRLHPHNALLQYWIDTGYLGLIVVLGVFVKMIQRAEELWRREQGSVPKSCFGFLLYLIIMGTTESIPTVYSQVIFAVFLLVGFLLLWSRASKDPLLDQGIS